MSKTILILLIFSFSSVLGQENHDYTILTYTQVGYNSKLPKQAMIQHTDSLFLNASSTFSLHSLNNNKKVYTGEIKSKGKKWNKYWWEADFSAIQKTGEYYLTISANGKINSYKSDKDLPITIGEDLLWNKTWYATALAHLHIRDSLSYKLEGGWKDCGSTLQELSSHAIMLNALCDIIELTPDKLNDSQLNEVYEQLVVGANYVAVCQDKAKEIGFKEGAVVHEVRENYKVVTGNVAKTAMILARISRIIKYKDPIKSSDYLARSIKAYCWIEEFGPILHWDNTNNYAITHGAPYGMHKPPKEWMTRDLVMMMWASLELYKCGEITYKNKAIAYAQQIIKRQVKKDVAEEGLYGHFPHYLIPLIEMTKIWPDHEDTSKWKETIHNFAYCYFLPACNQNIFKILPAGYYKNLGLLNWSGWYHGHNKIFGYAAALSSEFYSLYDDEQFLDIATRNLQWITGLHSGFHENNKYFSASMIVGIGNSYKEDWDAMIGTITNGFEADKQFLLTKPSKETDLPSYFGDEGGIHHTAGWISGLTHLVYSTKDK